MTNRTIQVHGQGIGAIPAAITVTFNGNVVFSGEIPTLNQPISQNIENPPVLFSFEVPVDTHGQFPQTVTVNSGTVAFGFISANYNQYPGATTSPEDTYLSVNYMAWENESEYAVDPRQNVTIDGVLVPAESESLQGSTLWWNINQGSVFSYDLVIVPSYVPPLV
jgi:hypothetical protein